MAADGGALDEVSVAGATASVRAQAFAALDRRLDPASRGALAVGLSGGGDSLALLALVLDWARPGGRPVLALTVDHGLHPNSSRWTADAGDTARALGAEWRALIWRGAKPSTGLPAAARRARHALLADAARAAGAQVLLLGHTADDRAESDLIRRETPGHGHLYEWAPSPAWPQGRGVFLLRPCLGVRRHALRSVLTDSRLSWLEDPANADPRFARTRARQALTLEAKPTALPLEGRVGVGAGHAAVEDLVLNEAPRSASSLTIAGSLHPPNRGEGERASADNWAVSAAGVVVLRFNDLPPDRGLASLACAIACAAGAQSPPRGAALARLASRLGVEAAGTATLGGARIEFAAGVATLCRELGRRPSVPASLAPRKPQVFDGRFELVADAPGWRVAPLAGHTTRLPAQDRRGLADIPVHARPAAPVLLDDQGGARLPRPFGDGPAQARELVSGRLAAALGGIDNERLLVRAMRLCAVHGA